MKKVLLAHMLLLTISTLALGQTPISKIGFADTEYIFSQMPEAKKIETEIQTLQSQLKKQYDSKVAEFRKKLEEYNAYGNSVAQAVKQNSERELQQLQQNIQQLEQDSQTELQKKNNALLGPVQEKIGKALEDVAKENGYSLILTTQVNGLDIVLFGDPKIDVSSLVLKKMGITVQP